jgi:hypothetical protein
LKPTAGKAKVQKWASWMANESHLNGLQRQSYIKDQSVIIPGKQPAAPIYGPSRELQIKVGPSLPTVYAQRLTPTDIDQLLEENQNLRNKVLDRMWSCPICDVALNHHDNDKIREHGEEHIKQMEEAGQCPWCENTNWAFMTRDQKQHHFQQHMSMEQTDQIRKFWKQIQCPACDIDFTGMTPEVIIKHCLKHNPNVVQYCDKCGLHEAACTEGELINHRKTCREAPDWKEGEPLPAFCEFCGKDTSTQTEAELLLHERDCLNIPRANFERFCTKCGLDISILNNRDLAGHDSRCRAPRGHRKRFCARCGTNLTGLDETGKFRHGETCHLDEPAISIGYNDRSAGMSIFYVLKCIRERVPGVGFFYSSRPFPLLHVYELYRVILS